MAGAATGPLAGLAFAVKDVFAVAGVTACYGNPRWLATHAAATRTAPAIENLLDAGARLLGLTLTDELALSLTGENHHYGAPINVRAPGRVSGGSSCGSAAAVAAGLVDFALGTDTAGSVRVPASHCGVLGFRPSHGAIPLDGVLPLAPRFDTVGCFAPSATVLARVSDVLLGNVRAIAPAGSQATSLPRRLLLPDDLAGILDPPATRAFHRGAAIIANRLGLELSPITVAPPGAPIDTWVTTYLALQNVEAAAAHRVWIERERPSFGSLIGRRFEGVLRATSDDAERAEIERRSILARATSAFEDGWLVWPSAVGAAPRRGLSDDEVDATTGRALALSALASLGGLPQVSLPLAEVDGCPLGVSLIGPRGSDRALLAAVSQVFSTEVFS
jgi:amidase